MDGAVLGESAACSSRPFGTVPAPGADGDGPVLAESDVWANVDGPVLGRAPSAPLAHSTRFPLLSPVTQSRAPLTPLARFPLLSPWTCMDPCWVRAPRALLAPLVRFPLPTRTVMGPYWERATSFRAWMDPCWVRVPPAHVDVGEDGPVLGGERHRAGRRPLGRRLPLCAWVSVTHNTHLAPGAAIPEVEVVPVVGRPCAPPDARRVSSSFADEWSVARASTRVVLGHSRHRFRIATPIGTLPLRHQPIHAWEEGAIPFCKRATTCIDLATEVTEAMENARTYNEERYHQQAIRPCHRTASNLPSPSPSSTPSPSHHDHEPH